MDPPTYTHLNQLNHLTLLPSSTHTNTYLSLGFDQYTGIQLDDILNKDRLDVAGEGSHLGVKEDVQGDAGVRHVLAELPHDPGCRVQHLTDPILLAAPSEEVRVAQDCKLANKQERQASTNGPAFTRTAMQYTGVCAM